MVHAESHTGMHYLFDLISESGLGKQYFQKYAYLVIPLKSPRFSELWLMRKRNTSHAINRMYGVDLEGYGQDYNATIPFVDEITHYGNGSGMNFVTLTAGYAAAL